MPFSTSFNHAHDPFKPPGGLLHLRSTILWAVLPEMVIFTLFSFLIVSISQTVHSLEIATTLLTVYGTVLGLLLTFKTNSAFASYQDGRRLWSSVILASRSFARIVWLHCPMATKVHAETEVIPDEERRAALIEKKTYINLVAAFSIALKHYVRGEAGIHYVDLYPLVNFLPRYRLPSSNYIRRPDLDPSISAASYSSYDLSALETLSASAFASLGASGSTIGVHAPLLSRQSSLARSMSSLPSGSGFEGNAHASVSMLRSGSNASSTTLGGSPLQPTKEFDVTDVVERLRERPGHERKGTWSSIKGVDAQSGTPYTRLVPPHKLLPARNPPPHSIDDFVPFWDFFADLFTWIFRRTRKVADAARGKERRKKKRPLASRKDGDNVPLELILILSGYVAALQRRKTIDVPTINSLLAALQSLSDALTGLERVLLTPMPIAYSLHLRHAVWIFLLLLPSHCLAALGWLTVPAVSIATFIYLGLLRLGDQIENPLGYDDSDLDLESFVNTVLKELREMCAHPSEESEPAQVVFVEDNLPFATGPHYQDLSATQIVSLSVPISTLHDKLRGAGGSSQEGTADVEIHLGDSSGNRTSRTAGAS
ncbi:hypothetical protein JCM6882_000179 [Rhodosporidiobolus microsporus]